MTENGNNLSGAAGKTVSPALPVWFIYQDAA
jgi:hypothetical protein